jgi:hypothetical protein
MLCMSTRDYFIYTFGEPVASDWHVLGEFFPLTCVWVIVDHASPIWKARAISSCEPPNGGKTTATSINDSGGIAGSYLYTAWYHPPRRALCAYLNLRDGGGKAWWRSHGDGLTS